MVRGFFEFLFEEQFHLQYLFTKKKKLQNSIFSPLVMEVQNLTKKISSIRADAGPPFAILFAKEKWKELCATLFLQSNPDLNTHSTKKMFS
jgi:hypothetical protein